MLSPSYLVVGICIQPESFSKSPALLADVAYFNYVNSRHLRHLLITLAARQAPSWVQRSLLSSLDNLRQSFFLEKGLFWGLLVVCVLILVYFHNYPILKSFCDLTHLHIALERVLNISDSSCVVAQKNFYLKLCELC